PILVHATNRQPPHRADILRIPGHNSPHPERRAYSDRRTFLSHVPSGRGLSQNLRERIGARPKAWDADGPCNNRHFPSWQGHLRLSLVTCPVALYPATSEADTVRFNPINPETNNASRWRPLCQRRRAKPGMERVKGIEPLPSAWNAVALPLSYTR